MKVSIRTTRAQEKPLKWYALYTASNAEKKVQEELQLRKIESFLPLLTEVRQWHDRKKKIKVPLFRNYLFAKLSPSDFKLIYPIRQVRYFVSMNGQPCEISERDIEYVRAAIAGRFSISTNQFLCKGKKVRITSGPFCGSTGIVTELNGKTRVKVRLHTMQQSLYLGLEASTLQEIATPATLRNKHLVSQSIPKIRS